MPRRRKNHNRQRKHRPSFPFFDLPPDLQFQTLCFLDLHTLQNAISAGPCIKEIYEQYPETLLRTATQHRGQQIQNLMLTTLSIARSIRSIDIYHRPALDDLELYFADNLDTDQPRRILQPCDDPLPVLDTLCDMNDEIGTLVFTYADDTYARVCRYDNPGAVVPLLYLSNTEYQRIARAFWRLKLFGVLFYNYADRLNTVFPHGYYVFLSRLAAFEIDELLTAYQFMVRRRLYFTSAFPHVTCPFKGREACRNRDPFECPNCQGRWPMSHISRNQALWHTLQKKFLGVRTLRADPQRCKEQPVRFWQDGREADVPNSGHVELTRIDEGYQVGQNMFAFRYRNMGWCFWETERLEGWDFWDLWQDEYDTDYMDW